MDPFDLGFDCLFFLHCGLLIELFFVEDFSQGRFFFSFFSKVQNFAASLSSSDF